MKFSKAFLYPSSIEQRIERAKVVVKTSKNPISFDDALKAVTLMDEEIIKNDKVYLDENKEYQVNVRIAEQPEGSTFPEVIWLSIKRTDKEPIRDWRIMQDIKNALVGEENEGFEIYPAESRKVDTANQYHMWVFSNPEIRLPVGFFERAINEESVGGSKQRKFEK